MGFSTIAGLLMLSHFYYTYRRQDRKQKHLFEVQFIDLILKDQYIAHAEDLSTSQESEKTSTRQVLIETP